MVPRRLTLAIRDRLRRSPAVALIGPRQCGKTTLARALGGRYFDLEQESDRLKLDLEWDAAVRGAALLISRTADPVEERNRLSVPLRRFLELIEERFIP